MPEPIQPPLASDPVASPDATADEARTGEPAAPPEGPSRGQKARSWLRVLGIALLVALLLRALAFEAYRIPSSSMEGTLRVGDFLFVSKLHYGPRTPVTVGLPFTDRYLGGLRLPSLRLPGVAAPARGDVVVFNFPPQRGPVDRKEHYVKRLAGLPGDTVEVAAKRVLVNGAPLAVPPEARQLWRVRLLSDTLSPRAVLPEADLRGRPSRDEPVWLFEASAAEAEGLAFRPGVAEVTPYVRPPAGDGDGAFGGVRLDHFGPAVVPARGLTIRLDDRTWPLYRDVLDRFEGVTARRVAGGFEVDGALTDRYTFRQDYLFVIGDNRDDSADSRTWGFVPESHLVGKAVLVYFSWDAEEGRPRWERMLRGVE
ncbi:MAG: signal peptidase I [Rubricoccaceae bacterium]|nr:signal peptidase I [Rubricoccaceae bacterium]